MHVATGAGLWCAMFVLRNVTGWYHGHPAMYAGADSREEDYEIPGQPLSG